MTTTVNLSSASTNQTSVLTPIVINDNDTLMILLSGVSENYLPCYFNINWGDGIIDYYDNDIVTNGFSSSEKYSSVFLKNYEHNYHPSISSSSQILTATYTIKYCNSDISTFKLPISVMNVDYNNSVGDLKLVTTILKKNKKIHQFITEKGDLVEFETPVS